MESNSLDASYVWNKAQFNDIDPSVDHLLGKTYARAPAGGGSHGPGAPNRGGWGGRNPPPP